jgi:hypothetical protein
MIHSFSKWEKNYKRRLKKKLTKSGETKTEVEKNGQICLGTFLKVIRFEIEGY